MKNPVKHLPVKHAEHTPEVPCGCASPGDARGTTISCNVCGATYLYSEVVSFPVWRCYDCGTEYHDRITVLTKDPQ